MSYTFPRHTYILPHREGVCQVVFLPRPHRANEVGGGTV